MDANHWLHNCGQGLDSLVFIVIAFGVTIPVAGLINAILTQWVFKSVYEALETPATYSITNFLKATNFFEAG